MMASTLVECRVASAPNVSPRPTTWMCPAPSGSTSRWPMWMMSRFTMRFSRCSVATSVPNRCAIADRVSPRRTT